MTQLFLRLFNISATAGWIVLAVVVVRLLFRKMPRWGYCLLWGIVGLRLLLPVTLESPLSLLPSTELIPKNIATLETPAIYSGIPAVNRAINPIFVAEPVRQGLSLEQLLQWASWLWLAGTVLILAYGLVSYWKLCRQVRISAPREDNVYLCDDIQSPFLLGFFKPRIYVPSGLEENQLPHILAHENAHIRRRDHLWKPLGFLLLCIYWFNPLLWVGYILLCRDIERACDEKVIADKDNLFRLTYMDTLVSCSLHRRMILACPVAFGEVSVKTRVKGIARYKKPTVVVILASVLTCTVVCICFLTTPKACAHDYTSETTLQATCTDHGVQTNTCRLCDHTYLQTTDCLAHTYNEGTVTRETTCVLAGVRVRNCTGCGEKRVEQIPILPHTSGQQTVTKAPNCIEFGTRETQCALCLQVYLTEELSPTEVHQMEQTVLKTPTCTKKGLVNERCAICGIEQELETPANGHTYALRLTYESSCSGKGHRCYQCADCGREKLEYYESDTVLHTGVDRSNGYCYNCHQYVRPRNNVSGFNSGTTTTTQPQFPVIRWDLG